MQPVSSPSDFELQNTLSLCLLRPLTPAAERWLDRHFAGDVQWFAGALVVEPGFLTPMLDDIRRDGLEVAR